MSLEPCPKPIPTIIQGEDAVLDVKFLNARPPKDPIDLTAATEIKAIMVNTDGSYLEKKMTDGGIVLVSGPGGHFQIVIDSADSTLLAVSPSGFRSDIEVHYTIATKEKIVILSQEVLIKARRFPSAP